MGTTPHVYENGNTPHRAAVIGTDDRAHFPDGTISQGRILRWNLAQIMAGAWRMDQHCTIIVDGASSAEHAQYSGAVRAQGWQHTTVGPWTLYHTTDGRTAAVGLRDEFGPRHLGVLIDQDDDPGTLAMLLGRYSQLAGINWRGTPATTALAKIRLTWENSQGSPRWNHPKIGPGYATGPLIWSRTLSEREQSWGWVHTFDATSAYLGSAMNAELAWSVLENTGPRPFDKHTPGYWHVVLDPETVAWCTDPGRPPLITPARIRDGRAWLTTPMVWMLEELGHLVMVVDSWTASSHRGRRPGFRILRGWGENLRDGRAAAGGLPRAQAERLMYAIKRTYKDATGGMQREGMRVYRPDWAHTLIDLWRVTTLRRIIRVHGQQGVWPVQVKTDSISYADGADTPQPRGATAHYGPGVAPTLTDSLNVAGCALGCGCSGARGRFTPDGRLQALGTYKHEATHTAASWTEEHTPKVRTGR